MSQALEAFGKLCDKIYGESAFDGVRMSHQMPADKLTLPTYESPKSPYSAPVTHQLSITESKAQGILGTNAADESSSSEVLAGQPGDGTSHGSGVSGGDASNSFSGESRDFSGGGAAQGGSTTEPPTTGTFSGSDEHAGNAAPTAASSTQPEQNQPTGAMPMEMGLGTMGQGGDREYKPKRKLTGDITEIFGTPERTAPRVIGENDEEPPQK